jgi:hypothetical protein
MIIKTTLFGLVMFRYQSVNNLKLSISKIGSLNKTNDPSFECSCIKLGTSVSVKAVADMYKTYSGKV